MEQFFSENFFSLVATIAAFGITYILKNISTGLQELRDDYRKLLESRDQTKLETQKELAAIRELIAGKYVTKDELPTLIAAYEAKYENK